MAYKDIDFWILQPVILVTSAVGAHFISSKSKRNRKIGFSVMLAGQPFWFFTTWINDQLGMFILAFWYAFCWSKGFILAFDIDVEKVINRLKQPGLANIAGKDFKENVALIAYFRSIESNMTLEFVADATNLLSTDLLEPVTGKSITEVDVMNNILRSKIQQIREALAKDDISNIKMEDYKKYEYRDGQ